MSSCRKTSDPFKVGRAGKTRPNQTETTWGASGRHAPRGPERPRRIYSCISLDIQNTWKTIHFTQAKNFFDRSTRSRCNKTIRSWFAPHNDMFILGLDYRSQLRLFRLLFRGAHHAALLFGPCRGSIGPSPTCVSTRRQTSDPWRPIDCRQTSDPWRSTIRSWCCGLALVEAVH